MQYRPGAEFHALVVATAVVWLVAEARQSRRRRPEARAAAHGGAGMLQLLGTAGFGAAYALTAGVPQADLGRGWAWAGLALWWCGLALRGWSFHTLGRYFTFTVRTSADQPVIDTGPYRHVRHPSYTGLLLAVAGVGLVIGNWLALLALLTAVTVAVVYRIRVEERALLRDLGERYRSYARTRKRLVPGLW
ncbi:isoprenylcysteine carboxylmethyltransferase family protein [Kitasatospora sp. NPDC096077]|uniref:methyltransferase family protein n=1 Tax=Kitasatospora sp. NPDC096077 TaxID=3155544 RepID=UPI00331BC6B1